MQIKINIEKKHFLIIFAVIAISVMCISAVIVFAGHGDSIPATWTVKGTYHFLQQVVKDDILTSVDSNNNGIIDSADDLECDLVIHPAGCIQTGEIADSAINSAKIADDTITTADTSAAAGAFLFAASPSTKGNATNSNSCNGDATCEMQAGSITGNLIVSGSEVVIGSVTANTFIYSSDERLKTNIKPISSALDKVQQLNGVSFEWKNDGRQDMGIIAQDIEKVYPELVHTDANGYKSVEYGNFVAVLIESTKELKNKVVFQQKEIDVLKERLELLEKK